MTQAVTVRPVEEPASAAVVQQDPHHGGVVGPHIEDAAEQGPRGVVEDNVLAAPEARPVLDLGIGADGLKTGHTEEAGYGLVASAKRGDRRVVLAIAGLDSEGARLRSWDVDLNPFKPRSGEVLIGAELIDRKIGDETVSDLALREHQGSRSSYWVIDRVRLARKSTDGCPSK